MMPLAVFLDNVFMKQAETKNLALICGVSFVVWLNMRYLNGPA